MKDRNTETKKIMEWGLREFDNYSLFKNGQVVTDVPVWLGMEESVPFLALEIPPDRVRRFTSFQSGPDFVGWIMGEGA